MSTCHVRPMLLVTQVITNIKKVSLDFWPSKVQWCVTFRQHTERCGLLLERHVSSRGFIEHNPVSWLSTGIPLNQQDLRSIRENPTYNPTWHWQDTMTHQSLSPYYKHFTMCCAVKAFPSKNMHWANIVSMPWLINYYLGYSTMSLCK